MSKWWLLSFLFALPASAQEFKWSMESVFSGQYESFQSQDRVQTLEADLRPDFNYQMQKTKFVLRPRWLGTATQTEFDDSSKSSQQDSRGRLELTDAYASMDITSEFRVNGGLEVYQWGPSELHNVSNPFFHLNSDSRSFLFKEKGQVLFRAAWDVSETFQVMAILNPIDNRQTAWREGDSFDSRGALKIDYRNAGGNINLGALGGIEQDQRPFVSEYGSVLFDSGYSIYGEARHTQGSSAFHPTTNPLGYTEMTSEDTHETRTLAIAGLRWEGRVDVRAEYLYNQNGYDKDEFKQAFQSTQSLSPAILNNVKRFLRPGLELYGKQTLYLSLRIPELGKKKESTVAIRSLVSMQDGSSLGMLDWESPWSDSLTLLFEIQKAFGEKNQEMTLFLNEKVAGGLRWNF